MDKMCQHFFVWGEIIFSLLRGNSVRSNGKASVRLFEKENSVRITTRIIRQVRRFILKEGQAKLFLVLFFLILYT